jgi:hypothetical protein
MTDRKADVAARLAELEYEIALAIRQGAMEDKFNWLTTFSGPSKTGREGPEEHWIAVLTVGKT